MKRYFSIAVAVLIVTAVAWFLFVREDGPPTIPLSIGDTAIRVEVAQTHEERVQGLGGREGLGEDRGMLYVFERNGLHQFVMKDMLFPLDIIWVSKDKTIADVMKNAEPESYPEYAFVNDYSAQYVLEVNAGFFDAHNLKLGDPVEFSLEKLPQS